jgi:hypothetical protein
MSAPVVPVSWGELLDKISILEIKAERIRDSVAQINVQRELGALTAVARDLLTPDSVEAIEAVRRDLKAVNESLWEIEDEIRICEKAGDFGPRFIELARAVYKTNDRRAALKRTLNTLLASEHVEEKSYAH